MNGAALRRACVEDLEDLLRLYGELHEEPPLAPDDRARAVLEEVLAQPNRHLTVAVLNRRLVGSADMLIVANMTHGARPWAVVENVVVTASARRSGVGRMLMEHLVALARAAGCYKVQLLSAKRRKAYAFYESLAFELQSNGFKRYL